MVKEVSKEVQGEKDHSSDSKHYTDILRSQNQEMEKEKYEEFKRNQKALEGRFNDIKEEKRFLDDLDASTHISNDRSYQRAIQNNPNLRDAALYKQEIPPEPLNSESQTFANFINNRYKSFENAVKRYQKIRENYVRDANKHNIDIDKHNNTSSKKFHLEHFDIEGQYSVEHFDASTSPSMSNKKTYLLQE